MGWIFAFFLISGFCSILYELVWLRLSMAQFGVTTALVSIVLSLFMAGIGMGSWLSGRFVRRYPLNSSAAFRAYALVELLIGISALVVPSELLLGRHWLQQWGLASSIGYYLASGVWLGLTIVPWCTFMGATIPLGMQAIRSEFGDESRRAFSYLYLANVLGAVAGTTIPLLMIEVSGFHGALRVGGVLNLLLACSATVLGMARRYGRPTPLAPTKASANPSIQRNFVPLALLFTTGLTSMGMEVVWIREFTPYLSTVVYAFAAILGTYLLSTFAGSQLYRRWSKSRSQEPELIWILLGFFALLPLIATSPKIHLIEAVRLVLGITPFSLLLGFVTPMLVDRWSDGDPDKAGSAYAVNVIGCILGPLLSGLLLLPFLSERWTLLALALPWLALGLIPRISQLILGSAPRPGLSWAFAGLTLVLIVFGRDYESRYHHRVVMRDRTATIIATGEGMKRQLLVNGVGITFLTPATKMMAHLPLASLDHPPQNALVVCFGMGTSFRSLLSWNIPVTAVELVPSVPRLFWYFHADASSRLHSPLAHVVIDDGRRYLERTKEQFDVITIDPPPPVEAAGSSLLYSREFYATLQRRLRGGGILQQWLPRGDAVDRTAIARALKESFPYVRMFWENPHEEWGIHFLASMQPLHHWTATELRKHMPMEAATDLVEWGPEPDAERQLSDLLQNEGSVDQLIAGVPNLPALHDDKPVNEYYLIRRRIAPASPEFLKSWLKAANIAP